MTRKAALAAWLLLGGCAQILGLDKTKPPADASIDAPGICDGLPACVGSGRQICGQLVGTGDTAGLPMRAEPPTGAACSGSAASGPCVFSVSGGSFDQLAAGSDTVAGSLDDCGRFVVDLDPSLPDVAVVFDGAGYARTGRAVVDRPAETGSDVVTALAVTTQTQTAWSTELPAGSDGSGGSVPVDTTSGFLVLYHDVADAPFAGEQAAANGSSPLANPAGTTPWAAYFTGAFDTLDPTATHTAADGAAFVVPGDGSAVSVDGFRTGKRCSQGGMHQLSSTLMFVVETGC